MGDRGIGRLTALVLLYLSAGVLGGCGEGTRQTPVAAGERNLRFPERPECDIARAVADIHGSEFVDWCTNDGPPDALSLMRAEKIGMDAKDQADVLVTVHGGPGGAWPVVIRFYGIHGDNLRPQVELVSAYGPFEPLKFFKHQGREFILAWGHSAGSGGGGPQWVLAKAGPRVQVVPYDNPVEKSRHLLAKAEYAGDWYLNESAWAPSAPVAADGLSFTYYIWGPGDGNATPRAKVTGAFALQVDSQDGAIRFVYKNARRYTLKADPDRATDNNK